MKSPLQSFQYHNHAFIYVVLLTLLTLVPTKSITQTLCSYMSGVEELHFAKQLLESQYKFGLGLLLQVVRRLI